MPDSIGTLTIGEPNLVRWRGLYDKLNKRYVNTASITWIFRAANADGSFNAAGALVSNAGGTMALDTGNDGVTPSSTGDYVGTVAYNAAFTDGSTYYEVATALDSNSNTIGSRKVKYVAGQHGSTK